MKYNMNSITNSFNKSICGIDKCENSELATNNKETAGVLAIKPFLCRCIKCHKITMLELNKIDQENLVVLDLSNRRHVCTDSDVINMSDKLTLSRLSEELFLQMIRIQRVDSVSGLVKRPYEEQARTLMYRIPIFKPIPDFKLRLSDIEDEKVKRELAALDDKTLDWVMRTSVGLVFECVNERLYNLGVRKMLQWKIVA
jgi:hypothetical protein